MMHAGRCSSSHINLNGGKGEKQIGSQWWVSTKWKTNAWWKILSFSRSPVDWRVVKRQLLPTISGVTSEKNFISGARSEKPHSPKTTGGDRTKTELCIFEVFYFHYSYSHYSSRCHQDQYYSQHFSTSSALRTAFPIKWYFMEPRSLYWLTPISKNSTYTQ